MKVLLSTLDWQLPADVSVSTLMLSNPTVDKGILMSRKDYVLIAQAFKAMQSDELNVYQETILRKLARRLASELANDNSAFRRDQFLAACGF